MRRLLARTGARVADRLRGRHGAAVGRGQRARRSAVLRGHEGCGACPPPSAPTGAGGHRLRGRHGAAVGRGARARRSPCCAGIWSAAFSADGNRVVTASEDWTARIWRQEEWTRKTDVNRRPLLDEMIERARIVVGRNMTKAEWDAYFFGDPYCKTFAELPITIGDTKDRALAGVNFVRRDDGRECVAAP